MRNSNEGCETKKSKHSLAHTVQIMRRDIKDQKAAIIGDLENGEHLNNLQRRAKTKK